MSAAGGIRSTLSDMLCYTAYQLDERNPAVAISHEVRWGDADTWALALNWQTARTSSGHRRIWQSGGTFGFSSYCAGYPDLGIGLVLLANEFDPGTQGRLESMAVDLMSFLNRMI